MLVVYSSHTGSSARYAEALASALGCGCVPLGSEIPAGERIVYVGWIRMDRIVGLEKVEGTALKAVCAVGLDDRGRFESNRRRVEDRNSLKVPLYYLRGWVDRSRLNPLDKALLLGASVMTKLRGLDDSTGPVFDAMMEGGSFYDESGLEPVIRFCGGAVASDA